MNKEQYSVFWEKESNNLNSLNIYEILSKIIPNGKVLEIGCGIGFGTYYLSKHHEVLSLDNNDYLIKKAKKYLDEQKINHKIHNCDLFQLTFNDKKIINQFKPNIIVGWFLGAGGNLVNKYIKNEENLSIQVKLYREKLEDIIISNDLLIDSVEVINFVIRSSRLKNASNQIIFDTQKKDYDTYVFNNVGFEVTNVEVIDWDNSNSTFPYSSIRKEEQETIPTILSITAKKIVRKESHE